jgi:anaerobic magnesium-protoporphyrin IX monomethyl ester cyclase
MFPFVLSPRSPVYEYELRKQYGLKGYMKNWKHRTMDSEKAKEHVTKTFLALENSGAIYRGDNQEMLRSLAPKRRQEFVAARHKLSKLAMNRQIERQDITGAFGKAFPEFAK